MAGQPQGRYEPVPGLLALPGFLWRRTPRWGQCLAVVGVLAAIVAAVIEVPRIQETRRENAARDRREAAAAAANERARLVIDQAVHRGRAAVVRGAAPDLVASLESAITDDVRARIAAGTLPGPRVRETLCRPGDGPGADAAAKRGGLLMRCMAATSSGGGDAGSKRVAVGFEFVAAIDPRRGTFAWCKTNPSAGEKFGGAALAVVPLSAACLDERR